MKRPPTPLIVVVVVALLAVGGWFLYQQFRADAVDAAEIAGTVDADEVQIAPLIGGRIETAHLAEGDKVETGQLLYEIDDRALQLQVTQAEAGVAAAEAAVRQAVADEASAADIAAAKARRDQAYAARDIARVQLSWARISSPTTGTVTAVTSTTGENASPGRTLATILKDGSLFVRAFVPEPRIGQVSIGQPATIVADDGTSVEAEVVFVASEAQFTPSNVETQEQRAKLVYEVRLRPTTADGLNPGMPVTVELGG